jgi:hypothetical protein
MRSGVVSMSHGWGGLNSSQRTGSMQADYELHGASTNDLISSATEYMEPINGMPWYSAVPVNIVPVRDV